MGSRSGSCGLDDSAIGQHAIEAGEFFHGDFPAPQRQRQSVIRLGLHAGDARALQELIEIGLMKLRGYPDCRNVAAANEGVLGGDGADEVAVEILRREGTERSGRVRRMVLGWSTP